MSYNSNNNNAITIAPDTSVIVNGQFTKFLEKNYKDIGAILISRVVLAEIEHQANQSRTTGVAALEELTSLRSFASQNAIDVIVDGERPTPNQIRYADIGELDAQIRTLTAAYNAVLITSDKVQASIGEIEGLEVIFIKESEENIPIKKIEDYFTGKTMSIHLRERNKPLAKVGSPGKFELIEVEDNILSRSELEEMAKDIVERAARDDNSFIESDSKGFTVVQLQNSRIIIVRPPFSDAMEITAVKPILKRRITDYKLEPKLLERIEKKSEGLLIVGSPGAGKSTFATALAEFYADKGRIVKTFENPRDLQVDDRITQFSGLSGDITSSADLILLMRPDHTVYDELRKNKDFETYADLRLAGIGLIGVIHGTTAIDGVKRFIKRVDLGVIPSIIDTIIFIKDGELSDVYTIEIHVKLPQGLKDKDLSRPVVEVRDFYTHKLRYEIYSFGEQIVVAPLNDENASNQNKISRKQLKKILKQYCGISNFEYTLTASNNIIIYVRQKDKPRVIGRNGSTIEKIESLLGIEIDVRTFDDLTDDNANGKFYSVSDTEKAEFIVNAYETKNAIHLVFPDICIGKDVEILLNGEFIITLTVGKTAEIKLNTNSELGALLMEAYKKGAVISALVAK